MPLDLASVIVILTVALFTPGPDMLIVLKNSLGGRARGLATVAGITAGIGIQTVILSVAFTLLAEHTTTVAAALRWGGACVLVYFGLRALLSRPAAPMDEAVSRAGARTDSAFAEGLLCNLTNPKAFLFFTGVFSQLIGPESQRSIAIILPALITIHGAVCWSVMSILVQSRHVAGRLQRAQGALVRLFGALLILFGLGLVLWRP